jgi:hypothetical protein
VNGTANNAVGVLTASSGAAGNPDVSGVTIDSVTIEGGSITAGTGDGAAGETGVLVADSGAASFSDGAVSITGVEFSAESGNNHLIGLDTGGAVVNQTAVLNNNTFDAAAAPDTVSGSINGFNIDSLITSTVQSSVDNVATDATVSVASGTYNESLAVDVDGLTLEGPNAGIAGDSDQRGAEAVINGSVTINSASNVTVDGFTAQGDTRVIDAKNAGESYELRNSILDANDGAVAVYSKADQTLLANNQITASGASNYGVRLGDAANVTFRDNRVIQEAVPDSSDNTPQGLLLSSTENAEVQGNVFEGVDSGQAVLVSNQAGNTSSVTVTDNDITGFSNGVFLFENEDEINNATVTDNAISDTTDTGISAVDTSGSDGFGNINGETTAQAQADALLSGNTVNSVTVEDVTVSDSE